MGDIPIDAMPAGSACGDRAFAAGTQAAPVPASGRTQALAANVATGIIQAPPSARR